MPTPPINRERIRVQRVLAGLTQTELARQAGISKQHASGIESGRTNPSPPVLRAYAEAMGCTIAELLNTETPAPTEAPQPA